MVDIPFSTWAFASSVGTQATTLPSRLARVINVVDDFGANPSGGDSTVAIQNALDVAFGSYATPHGNTATSNIPVYFPRGNYTLTSRGSATVTGCISGTSGRCRLTLSSSISSTFLEGDPVMVANVNGVPNANGLYFIHIVDSTHVELFGAAFTGAFTSSPSATMKLPCLKVRGVESGMIYGDGRSTSNIGTSDTNCALFSTNGLSRSLISDLGWYCGVGGVALDLNMTADPAFDAGVNLQSNTVQRCYISTPSGQAKYGIAIGGGGIMGSENMILSCYVSNCESGIITLNGNALQQTVISGNIAHNDIGIDCPVGSCPIIMGVGFQNQATCNINAGYDAGDAYSISGCRDENSACFLITGPPLPVHIHGCSYLGDGSGIFHSGGGRVTINCCNSNGVLGEGGTITILTSNFSNPIYLTAGVQRYKQLTVIPQVVTTQTGATYSIVGADCGSKIQFNRATAQTVTLPRTHGSGTFLEEGAKIDVMQMGAGQVTFAPGSSVTIRSRSGLKLAGQYATGLLEVVAADTWLLSGDTTT